MPRAHGCPVGCRCGHCKNLAPEYDSAAETLKEHGVKIAKMDATAQTQTPAKCVAALTPIPSILLSGHRSLAVHSYGLPASRVARVV